MKHALIVAFCFLAGATAALAMKITANVSVIRDETITIKNIDNETVAVIEIVKGAGTTVSEVNVDPDVYIFAIGDSREYVYLDNSDIAIDGFLDAKNPQQSRLTFTGLQGNEKFQVMARNYINSGGDIGVIKGYIHSGLLSGGMISALEYMKPQQTYENSKLIYDCIPQGHQSATKNRLSHSIDSLSAYRIGAPAPGFTATDTEGKTVSLSDFRGKYVIIDFWASWCGPCKAEIQQMKTFYPKYRNTDIVFLSISLDETKEAWLKGLESEKIPWTTVWAEGGFNNSPLKTDYGFRSIPFILLIDKDGTIKARNIRGKQIEEELDKLL